MLTLRVVALGLCAAALTARACRRRRAILQGQAAHPDHQFRRRRADRHRRPPARQAFRQAHRRATPASSCRTWTAPAAWSAPAISARSRPRTAPRWAISPASAWRYANDPERFRVDFRSYEFVAYQPGTAVIYMRTDVAPGIRTATDIVKAKGVVAGGLGAENSKDLLIRLGLDMLGVPYKYVTAYRGSQAARLALQRNEIDLYSESPPSYRAVVEPSLVRDGVVIPIWYEAIPDGDASSRRSKWRGFRSCRSTSSTRRSRARCRPASCGTPIGPCTPSTPRCSARSCCRRARRRPRSRRCARPLHASMMTRNMPRDAQDHGLRAGRTSGPRHQQAGAPGDRDRARRSARSSPTT